LLQLPPVLFVQFNGLSYAHFKVSRL